MPTRIVSAGARLDRLPIARVHWRMLGLIGAGAALDAFDIYLAAGVTSAPDILALTVLRFVMGIGLGAELAVAAGTLCEFIPPAYRGRWVSMLGIVTNAGLLVATSVGYVVIPSLGWCSMFAVAGVGAVVVWGMRKQMPEPLRWLEAVGRTDEANATLAAIEAEVGAGRALPPVGRVSPVSAAAAPFAARFRPAMVRRTSAAAFTCMAVNMSVYGFVAWLPTFLVKQGMTLVQSLGFTTLMACGSVAGALVGMALAGPSLSHAGRSGLPLDDWRAGRSAGPVRPFDRRLHDGNHRRDGAAGGHPRRAGAAKAAISMSASMTSR